MNSKLFSQIIQEKCFLQKGRPVVIGVSGGPDSLCLLDLLRRDHFEIIVGHLNHGLRKAAEQEEKRVRDLCEEWKIPYRSKTIDIKYSAKVAHHTVEEEGRLARYRFLFKLASEFDAEAVLVAHNLDDQVETVLMHLLRGTGLAGLRGMDYWQLPSPWSKTIPLVRPLLGTSKKEILEYCQENELSPSFDESNQEATYFRNRLRLELVPFLETFSQNITERIYKMAEVIREEDNFIEYETDQAINVCLKLRGENFFVIDKKDFHLLHPALKRRVIYSLMRTLKPENPNISFDIVQSALTFMQHPTASGKISLAAGLELRSYLKHSFLISDEQDPLDDLWPQISTSEIALENQQSKIKLNGKWVLELAGEGEISADDPWKASLDADKCGGLRLDTYHPGERFFPLGMGDHSIKVGDFWTNRGLPARARPRWPLVKTNNQIAWIPGFAISEKYKVTDETRRILVLRIKKIE